MKVCKAYDILGESFDEVWNRLENEKWVEKYLREFSKDECREKLNSAVVKKDWINAMSAAYSIKGMALNLGLSRLSKISTVLCLDLGSETFPDKETDIYQNVLSVNVEYDKINKAIRLLDEGK